MTGEELAWLRIAHAQHTNLFDCMENNSSTDFIKWNKYLDGEEYYRKKKPDYSLARIAYEIRCFMKMLGDKRALPESLDEFIPQFESEPAEYKLVKVVVEEAKAPDFESGGGKPGIEIGDGAELPPKWQQVNAIAKAQWGNLLGVDLSGT